MPRLTRDDYAKMPLHSLRSRLASVEDRMVRADTTEAALADAFDQQELQAAIRSRQAEWIGGAAPDQIERVPGSTYFA